MDIDGTKIAAARRASGLSLEQAAGTCGITRQTYQLREKNAADFRLCELVSLSNGLDANGQTLLREAIADLFF